MVLKLREIRCLESFELWCWKMVDRVCEELNIGHAKEEGLTSV
jgi:hypothetical protein